MKQITSLEDERRALLEQIHSSRETYRRMLTRGDKPRRYGVVEVGRSGGFPRSMTMRWVVRHPYMSAVVVTAAVALLGTGSAKTAKAAIAHRTGKAERFAKSHSAYLRPEISNETGGTRRTARTRSTDFQGTGASKPTAIARSIFTGLATAAAMILRDPRKMRAASSAVSAAARFVQSRRSYRVRKPHA